VEPTSTLVPLPGGIDLPAAICVPDQARGLVLFVHGSGSSRHSPRNRRVADVLNRGSIATILIDLLTAKEEEVDLETAELRFDIPLLGRRVGAITEWIVRQPTLSPLSLGYFGASTGAAAALVAAARHPNLLHAVVSRGGRPDLAAVALRSVRAPSLFIVGAEDPVVLQLNRAAMAQLPEQTKQRLEVIAGASHLFEEPGTLDQAAALARDWFRKYLSAQPS